MQQCPTCCNALQELDYDAAAAEQLEEVRRTELAAVRGAKETVEMLASHVTSTDFMYRDPERNWERSRVKGVRGRQMYNSCIMHWVQPAAC